MGDFEKKYPASAYAEENNSCTRPPSQKQFTHVQWAGKKFWQDVPWADTLNFCINKLLKDFSIWTWVFIIKEVFIAQ